jgi:hypothetical protein
MPQWDWLMGGAAIVLGLAIAASAIGNARWLMELRRPKWLAETIGSGPARGVLAAIGVACIALGLVILSGWRPPWVQ